MSVVVTGLGAVGSYGAGRERLAQALSASLLSTTEVDRTQGFHRPDGARRAALVGTVDLSEWVPPAAARRMSAPSKYALAAAKMAVRDAALPAEALAGSTAVVLGTAFGPTSFTEKLLGQILKDGPETASPFLFTECVANAPAAQIAIAWKAVGPNVTIVEREVSGLRAVARAAAEVESGRSTLALTGVVDELPPILHALLDRFGALARPEQEGEEEARPFDRRRSGVVAAEGSVVLVLETEAGARERGARILARIVGAGMAFDPTSSRVGWGRGHDDLARGLARMLARSGLTVRDLDVVVSGASGAMGGDRLEALTLRKAWSDVPLPRILAPKCTTGEFGGGFVGAAVLAASGAPFGPTGGFKEPDPELGIRPHAGGSVAPRRVLATSLAAGGAASWLVLERP